MDVLNTVIALVISSASISAIVLYLGKNIVDKLLSLGIEKYKESLSINLEIHKSKLSQDVESFKSELKMAELEHQIKYSKLHDERASTIKTLYRHLISLQTQLHLYTSPFQGPTWKTNEKLEEDTLAALNTFKNYFLENRIFLPLSICHQIDGTINLAWEITAGMMSAKMLAQAASSGEERVKALEDWKKQHHSVTTGLNNARLELENEFRKAIGV